MQHYTYIVITRMSNYNPIHTSEMWQLSCVGSITRVV